MKTKKKAHRAPHAACIIYVRDCPFIPAAGGRTAGAQLTVCERFAETMKWPILARFHEAGAPVEDMAERPGLTSALGLLTVTPDTCLLTYSVTSLTRAAIVITRLVCDAGNTERIRYASATDPFDPDTATGRMMSAVLVGMAEWLEASAEEARDAATAGE